MSEQVLVFEYPGGEELRLDRFLHRKLPEYSRSRLQGWIREGRVTVGGRIATKTGETLDRETQIGITIPPIQPTTLVPEDIPLDLIFENENLMVVNKPPGMVVHPSPGHSRHTLVQAALAHSPEIEGVGGVRRPGVVHRLDKDTSGLIILVKNDRTHNFIQRQFQQRTVEKRYLTLVDGAPPTPAGRVEAAIGRDSSHRQRMAVVPPQRGREAVSEYRTLESFRGHTFLEVHPLTGRQHQIRLQMAFIGCPVTGDRDYGFRNPSISIDRQFLHAYGLRLLLPGEETARTFEAPLPPDLQSVLQALRNR